MGGSQRNLCTSPAADDGAPAFMAKLRMAMFNGVTEDDVSDLVKSLMQRAKDGDKEATKLVFEYLLGGKAGGPPAPTKVVNQTINVTKLPKSTTNALRGSTAKLDVMARRARNGEDLFHPHDKDHD